MLLSFAQFEREVTGERIRDKIAASKRKGMWMGGPVPLSYEIENAMAKELKATSLRFLPLAAIAEAVNMPSDKLCQACLTTEYPTPAGERMYQISLRADSDTRIVDLESCGTRPDRA